MRRTCLSGNNVTALYFVLGGSHEEFVDEAKGLNKGLVPTASFHFPSASAIATLVQRIGQGELCTIQPTAGGGRATDLSINLCGHSNENNSGLVIVNGVALPIECVLGVCELAFRLSTIPRPRPRARLPPPVEPRLVLSHDRSFGVNCVH